MNNITLDRLRSLLFYNPDTGEFRRLKYARKDGIVGWPDELGYIHIRVDYRLYLSHRLAWFYIYGYWPKNGIDHINGNTADNRLWNLREADQTHNTFNSCLGKRNKSGCKGVSWDSSRGLWRSTIQAHGKWKQIGRFKLFCVAIKSRRTEELRLHGDFSRRA